MANAVPAGAFSSASANPAIIATEYTSPDIIKFILDGGVSVVSRPCYFDRPITTDQFPFILTEIQLECMYRAGRRFLAEKQARAYLNRAEHSSYQLTVKLQKKGFSGDEYQPALDHLIHEGLLDDFRFAAAWLHIRSISKREGYRRLFGELRKRGISEKITKKTLADFFSEVDEYGICEDAAQRLTRKGYTDQKLFRALQRKGFPTSIIKRCITHLPSAES